MNFKMKYSQATTILSTNCASPTLFQLYRLIRKQIVSPRINWLFQLKDRLLRSKYYDFNVDQEGSLCPVAISLVMVMVMPWFIGMAIQSQGNSIDLTLSILLCIIALIIMILGVTVLYLHCCIDLVKSTIDNAIPSSSEDQSTTCGPQSLIKHYLHVLRIIRYIYLLACEALCIIYAIRRVHSPVCIDSDNVGGSYVLPGFQKVLNYFFCGSNIQIIEDHHTLVTDSVFMLAVVPIGIATMFPSLDVCFIWFQLLMSFLTFIILSASKFGELYPSMPSILLLLCWLMANIVIITQMQLDKIHRFYLHLQLIMLIEQNQQNAEVFHVTEMRSLIANVAHDLKTPLMSLTSAITLITQFTEEYEQASGIISNQIDCDGTTRTAAMESGQNASSTFLFNLKNCLVNLSDTNTFMLMTINRCIDYAKAAKGIKLVPKLETIHIWEAMQMPLNCMRNVQDKVPIELLTPEVPNLCPYIITDKQWLQENLLCLLSNAVKYSNRGRVTVSVSLMDTAVVLAKSSTGDIPPYTPGPTRSSASTTNSSDIEASLTRQSSSSIQYIMFEVEDNGIGVDPVAMTELFKPFKQTQRLAGGTGLGLYSLGKRVEAIQGEFGVRNRNDGQKGSLFWFMIPYRPDEAYASLMAASGSSIDSNECAHTLSNAVSRSASLNSTGVSLQVNTAIPPRLNGCCEDDEMLSASSPTSTSIRKYFQPSVLPTPIMCTGTHYTGERAFPTTGTCSGGTGDSSSPISPSTPISMLSDTPTTSPTHLHLRNLDILLVDDAQTIAKMTSMMLKKLGGHRIVTAENGEVAVNTVETFWKEEGKCFDVILMDLQMPVLDGLEATKRIRLIEQTQGLPRRQLIVGVSANSDHETEEQALACGVDVFIAKPFTAAAFLKVINNRNITPN